MIERRALLRTALAALLAPALGASRAASPPALMLADVYRQGVVLDDYWVSEKYDGVRGYWDGAALWTRGGERVVAPAWFTAPLPRVPLDGELWAGRGRFALAVSTVRSPSRVASSRPSGAKLRARPNRRATAIPSLPMVTASS